MFVLVVWVILIALLILIALIVLKIANILALPVHDPEAKTCWGKIAYLLEGFTAIAQQFLYLVSSLWCCLLSLELLK